MWFVNALKIKSCLNFAICELFIDYKVVCTLKFVYTWKIIKLSALYRNHKDVCIFTYLQKPRSINPRSISSLDQKYFFVCTDDVFGV